MASSGSLAILGHVRLPAKASNFARITFPCSRRHESTYQRSRRRLNIKPDPSFLPTNTEQYDHIIYNPPASAPSVYHTPSLFLPQSDPRRKLRPTAASDKPLPIPLRAPYQKKYHLTEVEIEEMRKLRFSDPLQWSAAKLAKKFDCSKLFVSFCTEGAVEIKKKQQAQILEAVKAQWGEKRRKAREERAARKESWERDE